MKKEQEITKEDNGGGYKHMPFPWISKSKIKTYDYCPYSWYKQYILHERRKKMRKAVEGTNMHMVFNKYYLQLRLKHLTKDEFTDDRVRIRHHPLRRFIYKACMVSVKANHKCVKEGIVKPDCNADCPYPERECQRKYKKYKNIISNFATIETRRWLNTYRNYESKHKAYKAYKPLHLEKRLEYEPLKLFGTIDRVDKIMLEDNKERICIYDYKTGNVPKDVRESEPLYTLSSTGWKIPSHYMKEIHFYGFLYLLKSGWKVSQRVTDFLMDKDWWVLTLSKEVEDIYKKAEKEYDKKNRDTAAELYRKAIKENALVEHKTPAVSRKKVNKMKRRYLTAIGDDYKLFRSGDTLDKGDIFVGYYFLNGRKKVTQNREIPKAYRPIKKFNYRSLKSVLRSINHVRSIWYNKEFMEKPYPESERKKCIYRRCHQIEECDKIREGE